MKNLKQVLALGMAFSLSLSTMASAAFTDQKDIKAAEAVDMLSALGVIQGYEDGSFKPEGTVTRAEAAKMIFTIRNGGNSNADSFKSVASSFTDINGHWAEGYIKYCQNMGIIAGKSATTFDPNGTVTGVELAKMMLVTLGYDAEKAGLVGATWSQRTLGLAGENGLLDDVYSDLAAGCPRQYAAQVMYNSVLAPTVVLRENVYSNKNLLGTDNDTIGKKYMGLNETEVTLKANSHMDGALKSDQLKVEYKGEKDATVSATITFKVDKIETKIGENFKLLWKDTNNNKTLDKEDKVYGMYNAKTTTVLNITANDIDKIDDKGKVKLNGTKYDVADSGSVKYNYGAEKNSAGKTEEVTWKVTGESDRYDQLKIGKDEIESIKLSNGDKVRVVLEDNKVKAVYVIKSDLYKVTSVSGDKISIAGVGTIDKTKNDNVVYEGIAKDDVVAVTKLYDEKIDDATVIVEKAETVTGKLTGFTANGTDKTKSVVVDGTTYKVYNEAAMKSGLTDDSIAYAQDSHIDTNVTLYLVNGYVRASKASAEEAKQYAIVNAANDGELGSTFKTPKAELILADGTKKTVTLHKDSKLKASADANATGNHADGTDIKDATDKAVNKALYKGDIVKYVEMSNGEFKVEECGNYSTATADKTKLYNKDTKQFDGSVVSGDCVLFYTDLNKELKATTIRSLNSIEVDTGVAYASYKNSDGKVVAAYVNMNKKASGVSTSTMYGIVTSEGTTTKKDGDTYTMFTVATNGDKETNIYVSGNDVASIKKGAVVSFDKSSDDTYTQDKDSTTTKHEVTIIYDSAAMVAGEGKAVAVTEYNEKDKTLTYAQTMKLEGGAYVADTKKTNAVDGEVKIAYINAKGNKAGTANYGVNEYDTTTGYANAILVFEDKNEDKKVVAIIVNTNNETDVIDTKDVAADLTAIAKADASDINTKLTNADIVSVTGNVAVDANITVGANKTLNINGDVTLGTTNTLTVNGTLVANKITDEENVAIYLTGTGKIKIGSDAEMTVEAYKAQVAGNIAAAESQKKIETAAKDIGTKLAGTGEGTETSPYTKEVTLKHSELSSYQIATGLTTDGVTYEVAGTDKANVEVNGGNITIKDVTDAKTVNATITVSGASGTIPKTVYLKIAVKEKSADVPAAGSVADSSSMISGITVEAKTTGKVKAGSTVEYVVTIPTKTTATGAAKITVANGASFNAITDDNVVISGSGDSVNVTKASDGKGTVNVATTQTTAKTTITYTFTVTDTALDAGDTLTAPTFTVEAQESP